MADETRLGNRLVYEITIRGIIGDEWSGWFDGMTITPQTGGETLLFGPVVDQAALYGLLCKIHSLGLPLLSVRRAEDKPGGPAPEQEKGAG